MLKPYLLLSLLCFITLNTLSAQEAIQLAKDYISENHQKYQLLETDIQNLVVKDHYTTKRNGVTHVYLQQQHNGIAILQGNVTVNIKDGKVFYAANRLQKDIANRINTTSAGVTPRQAVETLIGTLEDIQVASLVIEKELGGAQQEIHFEKGTLAHKSIKAKLVYYNIEEALNLAWQVDLFTKDKQHHWVAFVDAQSNQILKKTDKVIHCSFGNARHQNNCSNPNHKLASKIQQQNLRSNQLSGTYNVFALPVESPSHGVRSIVSSPHSTTASPLGWHDDGNNEYAITRGNNAHAYQDINDNDQSAGDEPNGGVARNFNFALDLTQQPNTYQEAAVTNLFYVANMTHDIWYQYGFDEAAGNFQVNNRGQGGVGNDAINMEAQDGSGTNNANFYSEEDGTTARVQMYLWSNGGGFSNDSLLVNTPTGIAGKYPMVQAGFGPALTNTPITGDLILVDDGTAASTEACDPIVNGNDISGNVALIDRGNCEFVDKVLNAQNNGAIAVVMCNNVGGAPITMGDNGNGNSVNIPSVMLSQADCQTIRIQLSQGVNVSLALNAGTVTNVDRDGDFDNVIIGHEYGHGISIRIAGGPSTSNCLYNDEQMGEGWSDWFGLMMTINPNDSGSIVRGVGTYAVFEPTNGGGIRPAPYTTDMSINPYTYGNSNDGNISQPHGVGFIFATALWDMTWALIERHGYDPDLYNGNGGNNMAMQLVIDGLKLQPCEPGMIDGRDAILAADQANYGGANQCLLWEVFARRGFGHGASQGSSQSRSDQVESFDLPPICLNPTALPTANFDVDKIETCDGLINFQDLSNEFPYIWAWDFGDGNTSTQQNPTHTYTNDGIYTVTLIATNNLGADTIVKVDHITVTSPSMPTATGGSTLCGGGVANLSATVNNGDIHWFDANENYLATGNNYNPTITATTNYLVASGDIGTMGRLGPLDPTLGGGGNHGNGSTQYLTLDVFESMTIRSAWVRASGAGTRTITLWDINNNVLEQVSVNVPDGDSRINLNIDVPVGTGFRLGGTQMDLYRNNNGPNYPYDLSGVASITGSSAGNDYYYYLYDMDIIAGTCLSSFVPVIALAAPGPNAQFIYNNQAATYDFIDQSTNATTWLWDFGDGNTSTQQNPTHTYLNPGTYTVTLTAGNGVCDHVFIQAIVVIRTFVSSLEDVERLDLNPNFGSGIFNVNVELNKAKDIVLAIYNVEGKQLIEENLSNQANYQKIIDISEYPSGTYFLRMQIDGETIYRKYVLGK